MKIKEIKADIAVNGVPFCLQANALFALQNTTGWHIVVTVTAQDGTSEARGPNCNGDFISLDVSRAA